MSRQGKHFPIHLDEARAVGLVKACVPLKNLFCSREKQFTTVVFVLNYCEGAFQNALLGYDNNPNDPMLLLIDNSDSPSIVEQISQGPGLVYNTFIDDSS